MQAGDVQDRIARRSLQAFHRRTLPHRRSPAIILCTSQTSESCTVTATRSALLLLLVLLLAYLSTGLYEVRPGEVGVVRRFGRVLDSPWSPGLNLGLPWGLDRVDRVAVDEQRQLSVGFVEAEELGRPGLPQGQFLTGDNHLIDVRATVAYRVDRTHVTAFVVNEDRRESLFRHAAEESLAEALAADRMDPLLLGRARELELRMQALLIKRLEGYRLGLQIDSVNLTYAQPPQELAEVFREVNAMRNYRDRARTQAEKDREIAVSTTRTEARQIGAASQASARDRTTRARADADAFLALLRQADSPQALLTIYLREMGDVLKRMQIRVVSDKQVDQTIVIPGMER